MIVYYKLDRLLEEKGIKKIDLQKEINASPSTMANFSKNKYVALSIIDKICQVLKCQPGDIMEWVENEDSRKEREIQAQIDALQKQLEQVKANKN